MLKKLSDDEASSRTLMTTEQAASYFGVRPTTVERWRRLSNLPFVALSRRCYRYRLTDCERFAAERLHNGGGNV